MSMICRFLQIKDSFSVLVKQFMAASELLDLRCGINRGLAFIAYQSCAFDIALVGLDRIKPEKIANSLHCGVCLFIVIVFFRR